MRNTIEAVKSGEMTASKVQMNITENSYIIESSSVQLSVAAESLSEQYNLSLKEQNTSLGMSLPAQVFCCLLSPRVVSGNTPDNLM